MSAGVKLAESLGQFQEVLDESKHKEVELEQLRQVVAEMQDELAAEREKNKAFMEYAEIILDEDAEKEYQSVSIRSGKVFKDLRLRTQQLHGNTRPISLQTVAENVIAFGCSRRGWRQVMKERYSEKLKEQEEEQEDGE